MKTIREKIERCKQLKNFIEGNANSRTQFDYHESGRDGACVVVDEDKSDEITVHSWLESHHNGDSYDSTKRVLSKEEASLVLDHIISVLEPQAIKVMLKMDAVKEQQVRENKAKKKLEKLLQPLTTKKISGFKKCGGCGGPLSWTPSGHCCQNTQCREFRDDGTTC